MCVCVKQDISSLSLTSIASLVPRLSSENSKMHGGKPGIAVSHVIHLTGTDPKAGCISLHYFHQRLCFSTATCKSAA